MGSRKTSALVEAGLLAALAALFTLIGNYIPILYALANFLWPVALILCGRRHGLKWSILCLIVASILIALLLNPLEALLKLVSVSLSGIVIGEGMRRQWSPVKIIIYGSIATICSVLAGFVLSYVVMQINPLEELKMALDQSMVLTKEIFTKLNMPQELQAQVELFPKMAMLILPASLVIGAPFSAGIDYLLARKVLARLGDYYPALPGLSSWRMPKYFLVPYGLALAVLFVTNKEPDLLAYKIAVNVFYFMCVVLLVQALAVIRWYVASRNKAKAWFFCSIFLIFTNPLVSQLAIILGAYDLVFDFKKRFPARK